MIGSLRPFVVPSARRMGHYLVVLGAALVSLACSKAPELPSPVSAVKTTVAWIKPEGADLSPIFERARKANQPVFLYWGAVWCPPCNQVKATVFNRPDFIALSAQFLPVYLDGDTLGAQKLGAQFKVRGYPTMILFRPDGTELTRLPGEVAADQYLEVLTLALTANGSVKEYLATALGGHPDQLPVQAWRQLAYYAWEQDQAQLVPAAERGDTLRRLAAACPADQPDVASRMALRAIIVSALDQVALAQPERDLLRTREMLRQTNAVRGNLDLLLNYSAELVSALTKAGSQERSDLKLALTTWLNQFADDASLSATERLTALQAKLALAKMDFPEGTGFRPDAALQAQILAATARESRATVSQIERQTVIPSAADLLSQAGLLEQSDAMLLAELPVALSPYYHMLVLAGNAKTRGNKLDSLQWSEKAWGEAKGPATRLQWGSAYVNRLIELTPADVARIEKTATAILAELDAVPETFYERNRIRLEKMGRALMAWETKGPRRSVVAKLRGQLDAVCQKLPQGDEARIACLGVFIASHQGSKT